MEQKKFKKVNMNSEINYQNNTLLKKFVNLLMIHGKKRKAEKLLLNIFKNLHKRTKKPPIQFFFQGLTNISPIVNVQSVRVRRRSYQVPFPLTREKQFILGMKWLIQLCRKHKSDSFVNSFNQQIILASQKKGDLIKKRNDLHKLAKLSRPFANYRWL